MVSYDNFRSFSAKGDIIKNGNLRGFAMWEAGGDTPNDLLLDAIRTASGLDDGDNSEGVVVDAGVGIDLGLGAGSGAGDDDEDACFL